MTSSTDPNSDAASQSTAEPSPPDYFPNQASLDFLRQFIEGSDEDYSEIALNHLENLEYQLQSQCSLLIYLRESLPNSVSSSSRLVSDSSSPNSVSSHPIPSHPIPSHPIPSHPIPSHSTNPFYLQPLTPKLKNELAKEGKCFRCRQSGHASYSKDCPNRKWKPKRKQLNKRN